MERLAPSQDRAAAARAVNEKRVPLLAMAMVLVVAASCVGPFSEMQERQYPNTETAKASDPSGWIPEILPSDATSIHEAHYVDSNETWGASTLSGLRAFANYYAFFGRTRRLARLHVPRGDVSRFPLVAGCDE